MTDDRPRELTPAELVVANTQRGGVITTAKPSAPSQLPPQIAQVAVSVTRQAEPSVAASSAPPAPAEPSRNRSND